MKRSLLKLSLAAVSFAVCFVLADLGFGLIVGGSDAGDVHERYRLEYADAKRERISFKEAFERGIVVQMPAEQTPRPRVIWAPNTTFYLCYSGIEQPYFDEHGCVRVDINSRQIREREELCGPKPAGQKRVLCLGDSFTFGWGVRVEDAWPRRVEATLRARDDGIRTVNCGASGTMQVDEYQWALEKRFFDLEPDVVLVTLCLNDLLPTNSALCHYNETRPWYSGSNILTALLSGSAIAERLRIDPERDLVQELLDLPGEYYRYIDWLRVNGGREVFWPGGGPQRALIAMRDWCRERDIPFGVVIWPYFQGLGPDEHYPFTKIHGLVGAFCGRERIPFLDLLPTLRGQRATAEYWVSPADAHGNAVAHATATPAIAAFVARFAEL